MRNTIITVVIVVVVLIAGSLLYTMSRSNQYGTAPTATPTESTSTSASPSSSSDATTGQYIVTYTDNGFSPSTLTVPNGATVQFKNNASDSVWVASNPHPTHTDYPGFDALRNYGPGETYSFTFTKSGSWGYHNHLNPSEGGTIDVQ